MKQFIITEDQINAILKTVSPLPVGQVISIVDIIRTLPEFVKEEISEEIKEENV